jgi:hypothetical protein
MGHSVPRLPLLLPLLAAAVLLPAPAAPALTVGLAEQRAASFSDTRLAALPLRHARVVVAYDALRHRWQRDEVDAWMRATTAAGIRPLVTFAASRTQRYRLPSVAAFAREARAFGRRYPHVREYSPWNEPNLARLARNANPRRIAGYHRALRAMCPGCTVLGADVVDNSSLERWMRDYLRAFGKGRRPQVWGLHNYVDANSASRWGTRTMLRLAPGQVWFTETGAIVRRAKPSSTGRADRRHRIRTGKARARAATERVFTLARSSPRITRVYLYHWRADRSASWDSGLLSSDGTPRPSFDVFAAQLRASR